MIFKPQPWMTSAPIKRLFEAVPHAQRTLRFVGGCVRDALIGKPVQDIDLATSYKPEEITKFLEKKDIKVIPTGIAHGTIMAVLEGQGFEITTLRRDEETDGRHAIVAFTDSWEEDAARRDFTFNALYLSQNGEIYDPWNGVQDLHDGIVRFIGDPNARIQEDYLRILRYFRFYARFSKQAPGPGTLKALTENRQGLEDISGERIRSELLRLLTHEDPRNSLQFMATTGVLEILTHQKTVPDCLRILIDLEHQFNLPPCPLTRLYNLINQDKTTLDWILERYKFSNKESKWLLKLESLMSHHKEPLAIILHFQGKEHTLAWFLSKTAHEQKGLDKDILQTILDWVHTPFPITGQDLLNEGIKPGPDLGKELKKRERQWILDNFNG